MISHSTAGDQFSLGFAEPAPRESLFFALLPDAAAAERAAAAGTRLREQHGLRGRLLPRERLHVTLHYLGEYAGVPPTLLAQARAAAQALRAEPFELRFDQAGSFSGNPRARPLVLRGDAQCQQALHRLRQALLQALGRHGVAARAEAAYVPHMTLAYDERLLPLQAVPEVAWTVRELVLVRSLQGQGRHLREGTWPLQAAP